MSNRLDVLRSCYANSQSICDPIRFAARQQSLLECIADTLIEELEEKDKPKDSISIFIEPDDLKILTQEIQKAHVENFNLKTGSAIEYEYPSDLECSYHLASLERIFKKMAELGYTIKKMIA